MHLLHPPLSSTNHLGAFRHTRDIPSARYSLAHTMLRHVLSFACSPTATNAIFQGTINFRQMLFPALVIPWLDGWMIIHVGTLLNYGVRRQIKKWDERGYLPPLQAMWACFVCWGICDLGRVGPFTFTARQNWSSRDLVLKFRPKLQSMLTHSVECRSPIWRRTVWHRSSLYSMHPRGPPWWYLDRPSLNSPRLRDRNRDIWAICTC